MPKLKSIPKRLGYVLGAQWTRDIAWTLFTILLARNSPDMLGKIMLALSYGYLVRMAADVGLNDFLLASFARGEGRPRAIIAEVTLLKLCLAALALLAAWAITGQQGYDLSLRLTVVSISAGLALDGVTDSFFALCQARGRQDVEMRIRVPASLVGIGFGIAMLLMGMPPVFIALYKLLESLILMFFSITALGRNPLAGLKLNQMANVAAQWKNGLIFTAMAACAMVYNKLNVFFLKKHGGDAAVGAYSVAWETVEGMSVLVSSALLGKVIFPMLARLWSEDKNAFRELAGGTARSLWAAALPAIFLIYVESDRFLPFIYGAHYSVSVEAQRLLTPCLATAFLHNLAAYAMIGMGRHGLLLVFYLSGLILNVVLCFVIIPADPVVGAALALTITKVWVAVLTVSFFQATARPMNLAQWAMMIAVACLAVALWQLSLPVLPRELAELFGIIPLLILLWRWRPPSPFS